MRTSSKESLWLKQVGVSVLLLGLIAAAVSEIAPAVSSLSHRDEFLSTIPLLTLIVACLLLVSGLAVLFLMTWVPARAGRLSFGMKTQSWVGWVMLAACLGFVIFFFLFSPWQVVFTGFWTQALFMLAMAGLLALSSGRNDLTPGWREAFLAILWVTTIGMVQEIRQMTPFAIIYRGMLVIGVLIAACGAWLFYHPQPFPAWFTKLVTLRNRLRWLRRFLVLLLVAAPVLLLCLEGRINYTSHPFTRLTLCLVALPCLAVLLSKEKEKMAGSADWSAAAGMLLFSTAVSSALMSVMDYPFSLTWSEGNRFYDYSLSFASYLYNYPGKLEVPYFAPARYALWGSLFLIQGLPIWAHRLWNALMLTLPALVASWLMMRALPVKKLRTPLAMWAALFFLMGSVQSPLLVCLFLFLPFLHVEDKRVRGAALVVASLFAGLSRWTWAVGPGTWGALIDLFLFYPRRTGSFFRRIWPTAVMALLGVVPGVLVSWVQVWNRSSDFAASQPLLWYRMFPNATYAPGILLGVLIASGPLVAVLLWLALSRRWKVDWVQAAAAVGGTLIFLVIGGVASMKIGGGGDLHNLDLYLVTLVLLTGLAAFDLARDGLLHPFAWPRWVQGCLVMVVLVPAVAATVVPAAIDPLYPGEIPITMEYIQDISTDLQDDGEILFMDQRQLLTFGYIQGIAFVPDYEKKFMMDQAMAGNAEYFSQYYQDLANQRFSLIITEPLIVKHDGSGRSFGEENDAWVKWVTAPTLCFYKPLNYFNSSGVELLIPRSDAAACARYLAP